jgi:hypothetical protein
VKKTTTKTIESGAKCSADFNCPGMNMALEGGSARALGFHHTFLLDLKKGETEARLAYRFPKKVNGVSVILVNVCPWCGEKVAPAPRAASAATKERP